MTHEQKNEILIRLQKSNGSLYRVKEVSLFLPDGFDLNETKFDRVFSSSLPANILCFRRREENCSVKMNELFAIFFLCLSFKFIAV